MNHLEEFSLFELPLLVGISRKSMIYKLLGGTPDDALNGTTVLDTISLLKGADILRVHDVKAAVETVKIVQKMKDSAAFLILNFQFFNSRKMFIDFSIKDLIDILLVAYLLYQTYRLMKDSGSINIFIGILVFIGIWLIVSQVLEMKLLGSIFDKLVSVGVLALISSFSG